MKGKRASRSSKDKKELFLRPSRSQYSNQEFQRFWTEMIEKEAECRLQWHRQYDPMMQFLDRRRLLERDMDQEEAEEEKNRAEEEEKRLRAKALAARPDPIRPIDNLEVLPYYFPIPPPSGKDNGDSADEEEMAQKLLEEESKVKKSREEAEKKDPPSVIVHPMRTPDPQTKSLLYEGYSYEDKGRANYLRVRAKEDPEQKYEFPVTTSFDYGWRQGLQTALGPPTHPRTFRVQRSFYRPNTVELSSPVNCAT